MSTFTDEPIVSGTKYPHLDSMRNQGSKNCYDDAHATRYRQSWNPNEEIVQHLIVDQHDNSYNQAIDQGGKQQILSPVDCLSLPLQARRIYKQGD
ncbi:MAG: hypothetical protein HN816_04585 [Gammaproteobacteria bacterium]|nr:hypothetical protein [Gammaproteobacteria bacterium]